MSPLYVAITVTVAVAVVLASDVEGDRALAILLSALAILASALIDRIMQ